MFHTVKIYKGGEKNKDLAKYLLLFLFVIFLSLYLSMEKLKLKTSAGNDFHDCAREAQEIAEIRNLICWFDFNGVKVEVNASTNLEWLFRDYLNSWMMGWKKVGPDTVESYDNSTQLELNRKKKEREEKEAADQAAHDKKCQEQKKLIEEKLNGVTLELSDSESWAAFTENNKDPYGACCVEYAEKWGRLMQIELAKGVKVSDCADYTQNDLDYLGITGFMYGCAVQMLSQCWTHGEDLRIWHNSQYKHSGDGVVNPAVLTIRND